MKKENLRNGNTNSLQIVNYPQSVALKRLGFDWVTKAAPTVALALKWLRDEKGMNAHIIDFDIQDGDLPALYGFRMKGYYPSPHVFNTYEDAELALLDGLLTFLEKEKEHG
jgi:hypothetical protein